MYISGILITSPILRLVDFKLLSLIISSTVVLYFLAILYSESPDTTVYKNKLLGLVPDLDGILSICPTLRVLAVTLFKLASSVTDTPN